MPPKHSGHGIASFVISCCVAVGSVAWIAYVFFVVSTKPEIVEDEAAPEIFAIGLSLITLGVANFVALVLGIAGIAQGDRNRLFAILGTIVSAGIFALFSVLFIIGSAAE
jgi:hypothetical protein